MSATVAPRPLGTVFRALVAGDLVLFNSDDRRLHVLNDSAAAVWERLESSGTVAQLAADVADEFGCEPATVRNDVERVIDQFMADGLVGVPPDRERFSSTTNGPASALVDRDALVAGAPFTALECEVRVHSSDPEAAEWLDAVFEPLRSSGHGPTSSTGWVLLQEHAQEHGGGNWEVLSSSGARHCVGSRVGGVLRVVAEVNNLAVSSVKQSVVLHAGAVAHRDRAVVLAGESNRGKSTLTTALVSSGLDYLTDEAAAIDGQRQVVSFAKSIALDPGSFPLFPELAPKASDSLAAQIADREWHIDPALVGAVTARAGVSAVVCPHWRAGSTTRLARLPAIEALHVLLGNAFDFSAEGERGFEILAEMAGRIPVYRLGYSDLDEAVAVVGRLLSDS